MVRDVPNLNGKKETYLSSGTAYYQNNSRLQQNKVEDQNKEGDDQSPGGKVVGLDAFPSLSFRSAALHHHYLASSDFVLLK